MCFAGCTDFINITSPFHACFGFLDIKQWCDHVTVNPDDSRIIVFNRGTLNGLMVITPIGCQIHSVSIEGVKSSMEECSEESREEVDLTSNK